MYTRQRGSIGSTNFVNYCGFDFKSDIVVGVKVSGVTVGYVSVKGSSSAATANDIYIYIYSVVAIYRHDDRPLRKYKTTVFRSAVHLVRYNLAVTGNGSE